ncbi:MAG: alpha/beta fold hydrolase, partial [Rhizobiales bacterium]|nr:alpha/beta fold hydrolase [Hyphomicrobiales bacterium]
MRTELISIETDTLPLDGAFHWPDEGRIRGAVMLFHGNTMNFYIGAPRFLPPVLTKLGFACLAFNRRGHDIMSVRNSRAAEGGAFQLTREGIADNEYAAKWMAAKGYASPVVIGHSNGGMLGVAHTAAHPETPALVLLSAHRGGSGDTTLRSQEGLAGPNYKETMEKAKALVAAGRGKELMFVPNWWYVITAESYVDRFTTMPDTFDLAPKIKCPVLYVRGSL